MILLRGDNDALRGLCEGAAWLSSARAVRCRLKCHNERTYSQLTDPTAMLVAGAFLGMFVNGMMGGYGALMAEAYPTEARATAQNVLFNLGRAVGGFGPVVVGAIVSAYSFSIAIAFLAVIYVIDMVATVFLVPELKGKELS